MKPVPEIRSNFRSFMTASKRTMLRRALLVIQIILLLPIGWFLHHVFMPRGFHQQDGGSAAAEALQRAI